LVVGEAVVPQLAQHAHFGWMSVESYTQSFRLGTAYIAKRLPGNDDHRRVAGFNLSSRHRRHIAHLGASVLTHTRLAAIIAASDVFLESTFIQDKTL
jgi:hypothetical protein